jgi:hypothetical protein
MIENPFAPKAVPDAQGLHDVALKQIDTWLEDDVWVVHGEVVDWTLATVVSSLALLTVPEYESGNRRAKACQKLGIKKPKVLDQMVDQHRPKVGDDTLQGSELVITDVEPWDSSVDGSELLTGLSNAFRRFTVFQRPTDADALALWTVATYCVEKFDILPYMGVTAIASECGKSTTMEVLLYLVNRAVQSSSISGAAVYRVMECWPDITLLVDELDSFLESNSNPELVGIFNAGHKRPFSYVIRCVGDDNTPRRFNCFGPKAYGMIGRPPDTLLSRSIIVRLIRKDDTDTVEDLLTSERPELLEEFTTFKRKIKRWAIDNIDKVASFKAIDTGLGNRARDNWRPLLKIAGVVGTDWMEKALAAAGTTMLKRQESDLVRLLTDLRNIFHTRHTKRIPSSLLVQDLLLQDVSGWKRGVNERDEIDQRWLAKMMHEFEWESKFVSLTKEEQAYFRRPAKTRCYVIDKHIENLFQKMVTTTIEEVDVAGETFKAGASGVEPGDSSVETSYKDR